MTKITLKKILLCIFWFSLSDYWKLLFKLMFWQWFFLVCFFVCLSVFNYLFVPKICIRQICGANPLTSTLTLQGSIWTKMQMDISNHSNWLHSKLESALHAFQILVNYFINRYNFFFFLFSCTHTRTHPPSPREEKKTHEKPSRSGNALTFFCSLRIRRKSYRASQLTMFLLHLFS